MDVHKESILMAAFEGTSSIPCSEVQIRNTHTQVTRYFNRIKNKSSIIISCCEAGPTGFTLYRQLQEREQSPAM
ncbi:hypothetical protein DV872_20775 [Oceanispirochaeta sp. M1]|nr:hypothetical protein DV872_20775 [Oceanispirochaeta sp. M1]